MSNESDSTKDILSEPKETTTNFPLEENASGKKIGKDPTGFSSATKIILPKSVVFGIWIIAILLGINTISTMALSKEIETINYNLYSIDRDIESISKADILSLRAIKLQNSDTWTLPVASAAWNGR